MNPQVSAVMLAITVLTTSSAQAVWIDSLSGASSFGVGGDARADSTVNFGTWENPVGRNWVDDLGARPVFLAGNDPFARYVLFFQINNTDPIPSASDLFIRNFNVAVTTPAGNPIGAQPYTSGGYDNYDPAIPPQMGQGNVFLNPDLNAGLDAPNDWTPSSSNVPRPFEQDPNANDPDSLTLTAANDFSVSNTLVNGGSGYTGARFQFNAESLVSGDNSTILFLTTNILPGIVWSETEHTSIQGQFEAAGDIVGVKVVPESSSLAILAIAGMGLIASRRRKRACWESSLCGGRS